MKYTAISLFPNSFDSYINESILGRAQKEGHISFDVRNPRDFTSDKHSTVDDTPYGGGPGMVLKAEPLLKAIESAVNPDESFKIILFSPSGELFSNIDARAWAKDVDHLIFVCGRYEGFDARIIDVLKDVYGFDACIELSIGPYILTGGELPTLVIMDAVSRHISGVLGNSESPEEERVASSKIYTRPESFEWKNKEYIVPEVLRSGDHKKIEKWRQENIRDNGQI